VAVTLLILLLVGLTRARPGRDVREYDPTATTTTIPRVVQPPVITVPREARTSTTVTPASTSTTRRR
jgi:hypothetical protein